MSELNIPLITRVEGHGHVTIRIEDGELKDVSFGIHEGPRYFEALLVGRRWHEVPEIAARICGICTVIHAIGSAMAVEKASPDFEPPETLEKLRKLLIYSSHIQSHVLHLYFLAWPDYVGKESAIAAYPEYKELVRTAFRIKGKANEMTEILGGRMVHPCTVVPGGFTRGFSLGDLEKYRKRMEEILEDLRRTAEIFASLEYPDVEVSAEHLALYDGESVPLEHGNIRTLGGLEFPPEDYDKHIEEKVIPPNTTKRSYIRGKGFMVGALPRLNMNHRFLRDEVREIFSGFPSNNVHLNNLAQGLESYHFALEAMDIVDEMIAGNEEYHPSRGELRFDGSEGVSAVEAPRGILAHHYRIGKDGRVEYANIITPTAFNFEHIELALKKGLPEFVHLSPEEIKLEAERIIRAYDPCISCSAHVVSVRK